MLKIIRREFHLLVRDRPAIFLVLMFAASAYALLIGNLYSGQILQNIPVAVCDLNDSTLSRALTRSISETPQIDFTENLSSDIVAEETLERGEAAGVLVIPKNFSRDFYGGNSVALAFMYDGSNIVQVNYLSSVLESVAGNFSAQYNQHAAIANATPTLAPIPVSMSLRISGNTVQGYLEFYIYGVMLMAAHVGITLAFGFSVFDDKKNSALFNEFGTVKIFAAKEIFYLTMSLLSVMLGMVLLAYFFDMPFRGGILQTLIICAAFLFLAENLAGVLAMIFGTSLALIQSIVFYTLPALLTAGYIWPAQGMTAAMKIFSELQPVHYALTDFRRLALTGVDETHLAHLTILSATGVVLLSVLMIISARSKRA